MQIVWRLGAVRRYLGFAVAALVVVGLELLALFVAFAWSRALCSKMVIATLLAVAVVAPPLTYFAIDFRLRRRLASAILRTVIVAFIGLPPLVYVMRELSITSQRTRQSRTLTYLREIADRMEQYRTDHGAYPHATSLPELRRPLPGLPEVDGWCHPISVRSTAGRCEIVSFGRDGKRDVNPLPGPTLDFDDDIVVREGAPFRFPEGQDFR